jgi:hypothetical protein
MDRAPKEPDRQAAFFSMRRPLQGSLGSGRTGSPSREPRDASKPAGFLGLRSGPTTACPDSPARSNNFVEASNLNFRATDASRRCSSRVVRPPVPSRCRARPRPTLIATAGSPLASRRVSCTGSTPRAISPRSSVYCRTGGQAGPQGGTTKSRAGSTPRSLQPQNRDNVWRTLREGLKLRVGQHQVP